MSNPLKNPIQDLIDKCKNNKTTELVWTAFCKGVTLGGINIIDHFLEVCKRALAAHSGGGNGKRLLISMYEELKEVKIQLKIKKHGKIKKKIGKTR